MRFSSLFTGITLGFLAAWITGRTLHAAWAEGLGLPFNIVLVLWVVYMTAFEGWHRVIRRGETMSPLQKHLITKDRTNHGS
jgi:hypothetical protein